MKSMRTILERPPSVPLLALVEDRSRQSSLQKLTQGICFVTEVVYLL